MKLRKRYLVAAVVALAGSALAIPAFAAAAGPVTGLAGKCVDVAGGNAADGTAVQLYTCNGTAAQSWTTGSSDGTVRALGKCLDVAGQGTANGTKIQLWDCNGQTNQKWTSNGAHLVSAASGRCLDVTGQNSADATRLQIWDCNGQTNQNWVLPGGGTTTPGCTRSLAAGQRTLDVTFAGQTYPVAVYVPSGVAATTPLPLVLDLHGTQGTGPGQLTYSNIEPTADAGKFLVAAPTGVIATNPGYTWYVPGVTTGPRDDIGFLGQVITTATTALCGDSTRVYGTGYSGGGRMISAFACAQAGRIAAIAPVAGLRAGYPDPSDTAQPLASSCAPSRPVPIVAFHGQADNTNPYGGGGGTTWLYSVPVAQQRWSRLDGCTAGPATTTVSTHVTRTVDSSCTNGVEVQLYTISNGGHTWPDSPIDNGNGTVTDEISADNLMWTFFQQYHL